MKKLNQSAIERKDGEDNYGNTHFIAEPSTKDERESGAEAPDFINLMEWNRFAEQGMTLLEVLTILNNRHRAEIVAAEIHTMRELNAAKAELAELKKQSGLIPKRISPLTIKRPPSRGAFKRRDNR